MVPKAVEIKAVRVVTNADLWLIVFGGCRSLVSSGNHLQLEGC